VRHSSLLEHPAAARDQAPWNAWRTDALAPRRGTGIPPTRDEAPGLLADVAQHLGAPHSPDRGHGQPARRKAGAAPLAAQQRAAAQALRTAEETRSRGPPPPQRTGPPPARRGPGRPSKAAPGLEPATPAGAAARQESPRLAPSREQMRQSLRAMGPASPCVALARGIRRHGTRIARYPTAPRDDPHSCPAGTAQRGVPGASRASRAGGPQHAGPHRLRLGRCAAAGEPTGLGPARVLRQACAAHSRVLSRAPSRDQHPDRGHAASGAGRGPPSTAVCARWRGRSIAPSGATHLAGRSGEARGGVPALQGDRGRAQRVSLVPPSPAARARSSQKACRPDGCPPLFPHAP
jgi:hypothetical protein